MRCIHRAHVCAIRVLITVTLGTMAKVRVETKADGTGLVVPDQVVGSGDSIQVFAVARDSANNFI